jgi:hypothetical protein
LDLKHRHISSPVCQGAIEVNVDKLVVHRMKERGYSWRLPGVRAVGALCRHRDRPARLAFCYLPLAKVGKAAHRKISMELDYSEVINKPIPVCSGLSLIEPWVISLFRYTHGSESLSYEFLWEFDSVTQHTLMTHLMLWDRTGKIETICGRNQRV